MGALDNALRKVAKKLAPKLGKSTDLEILRQSAAAYDTTTLTGAVTETREAVSGFLIDVSQSKSDQARKGDVVVLIPAADDGLTAAPDTDCRLALDGDEYEIVDVNDIGVDQAIFHEVVGRG